MIKSKEVSIVCENGKRGGCINCPYCYNHELCLVEDNYVDIDSKIIGMEYEDDTIKIVRFHKE